VQNSGISISVLSVFFRYSQYIKRLQYPDLQANIANFMLEGKNRFFALIASS
jgi:hypothetical protein